MQQAGLIYMHEKLRKKWDDRTSSKVQTQHFKKLSPRWMIYTQF